MLDDVAGFHTLDDISGDRAECSRIMERISSVLLEGAPNFSKYLESNVRGTLNVKPVIGSHKIGLNHLFGDYSLRAWEVYLDGDHIGEYYLLNDGKRRVYLGILPLDVDFEDSTFSSLDTDNKSSIQDIPFP